MTLISAQLCPATRALATSGISIQGTARLTLTYLPGTMDFQEPHFYPGVEFLDHRGLVQHCHLFSEIIRLDDIPDTWITHYFVGLPHLVQALLDKKSGDLGRIFANIFEDIIAGHATLEISEKGEDVYFVQLVLSEIERSPYVIIPREEFP